MAKPEFSKTYEPSAIEDEVYGRWEASGFFNPDKLPGDRSEMFSVMMPPPNVTGILHLGHALENALMDVQVRYQRMNGKKALLVPGTDHAAVATQARVESDLKKEGIVNPRQELGRDGLLEKIRTFAEDHRSIILGQIKKLGTSCDWSRLAYTFDETRSRAVNELFARMYNDGLIYRGYRVVHWSVKGQSTCSDDELEYVEQETVLYTFKYSNDFPIAIATTRPETKLGDTAVAVHPEDARYKTYIGQVFTINIGAAEPLKITIIADENVDPQFGTGAVGVTPAHSMVDFEMYQKNKHIGIRPVIGIDGRMTTAAGKEYAGLTINEAREKFVEYLRTQNLISAEEKIMHSVGTSDRFGDIIEELPMEQWFIDVNKEIPGRGKSLKQLMRDAVTTGHGDDPTQKITIVPDRFHGIYLAWIDNLRDWCISRQIWWGHRIPVWYKTKVDRNNANLKFEEETYVGITPPDGPGWEQDPDTLDTWFSSGAWTFSTLGWPDQTSDLKLYHPTSWMQMGTEILFFWMARMVLMTTYALDAVPFRRVYFHGILRDKDGKKFSKSLGNGIDPLEMINQYGTDALRLSVLRGITPGNDARFYEEKIEGSRNFINKLWNISRFIAMQVKEVRVVDQLSTLEGLSLADQAMLHGLHAAVATASKNLDAEEFSYAIDVLNEFTWNEFADWYVETAKIEGNKDEVLLYALTTLLKAWHPFIPFVTEAIWQQLGADQLLMVAAWPKPEPIFDATVAQEFTIVKETITGIRNLRAEFGIAPSEKIAATLIAGPHTEVLTSQQHLISQLGRLSSLTVIAQGEKIKNALSAVTAGVEIYLPISGTIDVAVLRARLEKEADNLQKYIKVQEGKLANTAFTDHAPDDIVEAERTKLATAKTTLEKISLQLQNLTR